MRPPPPPAALPTPILQIMNEESVQYSDVRQMVPTTPLLSPQASPPQGGLPLTASTPKATSWADADMDDETWVAPSTWFGTVVIEEAPPSPTFLPPAPEFDDEPKMPDLPVRSEFVVYSEHQMLPEPAFPAETATETPAAPSSPGWLEFAGGAFDEDMREEQPAKAEEADEADEDEDEEAELARSDVRLSKFAPTVPEEFQRTMFCLICVDAHKEEQRNVCMQCHLQDTLVPMDSVLAEIAMKCPRNRDGKYDLTPKITVQLGMALLYIAETTR